MILADHEARIVREILRAHLPPGASAWAFGSRATGAARHGSDLDLAIDAGRALTFSEMGGLREAFEESDLPFRVDVLDWQAADERFRRLIADTRVPLLGTANLP